MQLKPGTRLQGGKYEIIKTLGQGGFGITYEADHLLFGQKVALKEFFMKDICNRSADTAQVSVPSVGSQELAAKFKEKFIKEARMMFKMNHPNIVRVLDVFEENDTAYYVMEDLPGGSLADKVKREGPLPEALAEKYIRQVASALNYIHSRNTVHMDVKPSNILLNPEGNAVLIDFGISKHYDNAGEQTSSTPVGISKGYAPLEQGRDGDVSQFKPSTDIYALGATLYHLVSGKVPPEASIVNEDGLDRPEGVSDRIWVAIEKAMQPRRKDRPQSIGEFLALLDAKDAKPEVVPEKPVAVPIREAVKPIARPVVEEPKSEETVVEVNAAAPKASGQAPKPLPTERKRLKPRWLAVVAGLAMALVAFLLITGKKNSSEWENSQPYTLSSPSYEEEGLLSEYVDLGLSVKWATCNVGATKPEEYGDYYAWGETETKTDYTWSNYKFRTSGDRGDNISFYKYNMDSLCGPLDNKTVLDPEDDVAHIKLGGGWRLPTDAEWTELRTKCTWTWAKENGVFGRMVTARNGNSIFLPAAGYQGDSSLFGSGTYGSYWSSSLYSDDSGTACSVYFGPDSFFRNTYLGRYYGFSVRPVSD